MKKFKLDIAPKTILIITMIVISAFFFTSIILCLIGGLLVEGTEEPTTTVKTVTVKITEEKETAVKTTKEPQETINETKEPEKTTKIPKETINNIQNWKVAYDETYSEFFEEIKYMEDEAVFVFYPNKEMKESILELASTKGQESDLKDSWYNMLEGFKEVTNENKHIIAIANPYNTENLIMIVDNGNVLYSEF